MKLGIDFGTTRTRVAAAIDGNYPLVSFHSEDTDTQDWYPSLIAVRDGRAVFGLDALKVQHDPDWDLCRSFKRLLENTDPLSMLTIGGVRRTLLDWLTLFLASLKEDLVHRSNLDLGRETALEVVVGVPANANSNQRFVTLEAFQQAGFEVLGMLNEPSAAGIEYAHRYRQSDLSRRREHIAVYDFGGGTFDVSVIRMSGEAHEVVSSEGISRLGGDDLDEILLNLTLAQPSLAEGTSKWISRSRLLNLCREAKESINPNSRKVTVDLGQISLLGAEVLFPVSLFFESCEPLIQRTLRATEAAVQAVMGENSAALACVYLVGGSCELPLLARSLRERFGKRVRRSPYPSAATAIGLAISAAHSSNYRLEERFHRYFGVWRESESGTNVMFDPIFSKGTPLPAQGQKPIAVKRCYQPAHNIGHFRFIECSQLADSREPRGDIVAWDQILFPFDPAIAAESDLRRVEVLRWSEGSRHEVEELYECDSRGIIEVAIADHTSGIRRSYRLRGAMPEKALAEPG